MVKKIYVVGIYTFIVVLLIGAALLHLINAECFSVLLLIALFPIFIIALYELFHGILGTEFFISCASLIGFFSGELEMVGAILVIMLIAQFFETLIDEKTDQAIDSLLELIPHEATVEIDSMRHASLDIKKVVPGMVVIVKSGESIPVDGKIIYGFAFINESSLTGESFPREKSIGNEVFAGSFIENGMVKILVQKAGDATLFAKIKQGIEASQKSKALISIYTNKIATILVPLILVGIVFIWLLTGNTKLVVTLLVFGSPLELTLIVPLAILAGVIAAFRKGILVKGGSALEGLSLVDIFAFDKTGTLTMGSLEIAEIVSLDSSYTSLDILKLAAIAEKNSEHLIARAILNKAKEENIEIPNADSFEPAIGYGVKVVYMGKIYFLGSKKFANYLGIKIFEENKPSGNAKCPTECPYEGLHGTFYIFSNEQLLGRICMIDQIRGDAKKILKLLDQYGIRKLCLLSGDNQHIVKSIAKQLNIKDYCGDLLPHQKAEAISRLQDEKYKVAMVGDGINDAPALKQADIGIVLGGTGMGSAIESGDIIVMSHDLNKILFIIGLSKKIMTIIKQNIFFGFILIHCGGMVLAFFQLISPIRAALFHSLADFLILVNSFRIIRFKGN